MALLRLMPVKCYAELNFNREIYPDYKCNCNKDWKNEDRFIIYKAHQNSIEKIYDSVLQGDNESNSKIAVSLIGQALTDKALISGGHTVVNLKDRLYVGPEVIRSVDFSFNLIANLQIEFNKKSNFLIMLNDFYMEKDAGTDEGAENKYRKEALNPYIVPPAINEVIVEYNTRLKRDIDLYYCSEKNMADRFKRHIQNQKKSNIRELFVKKNNSWNMNVGGKEFAVLINDKPTCASGNAATFRAIRYQVSSNKLKDNFTSYVGVFPLCSLANVLNGFIAANAFYEQFDLPSYFIFFGKSCF